LTPLSWGFNPNGNFGYLRRVKGLPQLPSFHAKSRVLEIHKCETHFKVSHNKESHKVEILAKIYFSITG
jgi:hypothetical protein